MTILADIISWLIFAYQFLIFVRVILSWVNVDPYRRTIDHPLVDMLNRITDPVLNPLRRLVPPVGGTLDISPVVALIILEIVQRILVPILRGL